MIGNDHRIGDHVDASRSLEGHHVPLPRDGHLTGTHDEDARARRLALAQGCEENELRVRDAARVSPMACEFVTTIYSAKASRRRRHGRHEGARVIGEEFRNASVVQTRSGHAARAGVIEASPRGRRIAIRQSREEAKLIGK